MGGLGALVAASVTMWSGALLAGDFPLVHVKTSVKDGGVQLEAQADAPFECATHRPVASLYILDLTGVMTTDSAGPHTMASDLVKSYFVLSYVIGDKPVVRIEIVLAPDADVQLERKGERTLVLWVARNSASGPPVRAVPSPPAPPIAGADARAAVSEGNLRRVELAQNGDATQVRVSGSSPLAYHLLHLQSPDRLVLDFAGCSLNVPARQIPSNLDPVRQVRMGQFTPEISRVVIDLSEPARYSIQAEGSTVTVLLKTKPTRHMPERNPQ